MVLCKTYMFPRIPIFYPYLHHAELPHLPTTWNDITKEEAIDSLSW
jgi:hypothetical protein